MTGPFSPLTSSAPSGCRYGCRWPARPFDPQDWDRLADSESAPVRDLAIGADASPGRESATVCVAGRRRQDGRLHCEWYWTADGVRWLPDWVGQRLGGKVRAVVVDQRNPAAELDWASAGVRPTLTGVREMAAACGGLFDAVTSGAVRHPGQVELTRGVLGAKQRPMVGGQGFGWERKGAGASTLIAASPRGVGCVLGDGAAATRRKPGEADGRVAVVL